MIRKALEHTQLWSWIYTSDSVNLAENYLYLLSGSLSSYRINLDIYPDVCNQTNCLSK